MDYAAAFSEVKSLPDHALHSEFGKGRIPDFLILGEFTARNSLRSGTADFSAIKRPSMAEEARVRGYSKGGVVAGINPFNAYTKGLREQKDLVHNPDDLSGQSIPLMPQMPAAAPELGSLVPMQPGIPSLMQQPQGFAKGGLVNPIEAYIRQAAIARNMDPDKAVRVARSEGGLDDPYRQGEAQLSYGREESYGPFQLHMRQGGVGTRALAAGIDPRKDWKGGVDYALNEASQKGWGQWYGAAKAGVGKWDGIRGSHPASISPDVGVASLPQDALGSAAQAGKALAENTPALAEPDPLTGVMALAQMMQKPKAPPPPVAPMVRQKERMNDPNALTAMTSQTPDWYRRRGYA